MKWPLFEHKIQQTLSGHRTELDVEALWAAIEPQVDAINARKRKRRLRFYWLLLTVLAVAGGVFSYAYFSVNHQTTGTSTAAAVAAKNNVNVQNEAVPDSSNAFNTVFNPINHNSEINTSGAAAHANITLKEKPETAANAVKTSRRKEKNVIIFHRNNTIIPGSVSSSTHLPEEDIMLPLCAPSMGENAGNGSSPDLLPLLQHAYLELSETGLFLPIGFTKKLPETLVRKRRKAVTFFAGVHGGISFTDRKLDTNRVSFLLPLRNKTERSLETTQVGLRLQAQHKSGMELSTGVQYTQINERFQYFTSVTALDTVAGVEYYYINFNEDTIAVYGEIPTEKKTTFHKEYYNKYRLVDIPVIAGYRFTGRDYTVGVQAGVFVNVKLAAQGRFLQSESEDIDIKTASIFKSRIGLSYYFGLSASYLLNEHLGLEVSPFMRYFPGSFTKNTYELKQRYNLYGVNMGVMYRFNAN